jgi:O-antigen ligase
VAVSVAISSGDRGVAPGAVVLAAAIPILFLHVQYQPGFAVGIGSTTINAYLSDFAVLAVVVAALAEGLRRGFAPLATGRWLWLALALFVVWIFAEVVLGHLHAAGYASRTHGVTATKFAEYALLAPAVPLLLRRGRDLLLPLWSVALWSAAATVVGIAQFFGADILFAGPAGRRQASFLGDSDFAALSAAAILVGIVALALPRARVARLPAVLATTAGALGMILAGAVASLLGLLTALAALALIVVARREIVPRRLAAVAAIAGVVAGGVVAIRGNDLGAFARFVDTSGSNRATPTRIQTYAHRTLLAWIGWQIWKDHPLLGVGWEGSAEPANFGPYLPAAHRRFHEAPQAFPSAAPNRRYGVQNAWIEALADLGVAGLALWTAVFATAAWLAGRAAVLLGTAPALYALLAVAVVAWLWAGQGFVAGIPLDALTWLALGLTATRLDLESAVA